MKKGLFIVGIIMIVISIVTFLYTIFGFQECVPIIDDIGSFPSTDISQKCEIGELISMVGGPLFIIGLGMMIGVMYPLWRKRNEN